MPDSEDHTEGRDHLAAVSGWERSICLAAGLAGVAGSRPVAGLDDLAERTAKAGVY